MTPAQLAALGGWEGAGLLGCQGTFRVDPTTGLNLLVPVYQDSGGALNVTSSLFLVAVIA